MPVAMSVVWDVVKNPEKSKQFAKLLLEFDKVLGVDIEKNEDKKEIELPQEIKDLLEQRKQARENKDWALSDKIRDELKEKGYDIDKKKIIIDVPLNVLGNHFVEVELHKKVKAKLNIELISK